MKKLFVSLLLPLLSAGAWSQDVIYRCGNEYTNQIKGRTGCKAVEGGNVTVVRGTAPSGAAAAPSPAPARSSGGGDPSAAAPRPSSAPAAPRIDTPDQRARDSDAKTILEQELRRAETRQAELKKEFNNGEPERQGNERNYAKYQERVAQLKDNISRTQQNVEALKREIANIR